ncbi:MAG: tRNA (N6-threonylcarbamoyladenosine(37)-N6)-methyltransferase TrmO [Verrucomicrobiota bacterium]|nr:tRNA (N6-threonylcarbamoyladenosine(37)-N6)-methyltransferase TrmO [Verrucomicrobiota bacterium]
MHDSPTLVRRLLVFTLTLMLIGAFNAQAGPAAGWMERLQQGDSITIVTLGTSLSAGKAGWPVAMMEWLDSEWPGQTILHNLAVGGSASQTVPAMDAKPTVRNQCGLDRLPEAIASRPDVVFIEFAVNDAFAGYGISPQAGRANLETMIDRLQQALPDSEIILQTMNSVLDTGGHTSATDRPELDEHYEQVRAVARQRGLRLIDHHSRWRALMQQDRQRFLELVPDGIHPSLEGCREIIRPGLQAVLKPTAKASATTTTGELMPRSFTLNTIGYVRIENEKTLLVLEPEYEPGLLGLDGFSHVHVLWWFDRNDNPKDRAVLQVHPRGNPDNPLTGVFATRSPRRPNLLAKTLCKIIAVRGNIIEIESIDALDQTPIIDLKPFIPAIDTAPEVRQPAWINNRN